MFTRLVKFCGGFLRDSAIPEVKDKLDRDLVLLSRKDVECDAHWHVTDLSRVY
jgi:hypothetical protein